jgi:hypothetical protein
MKEIKSVPDKSYRPPSTEEIETIKEELDAEGLVLDVVCRTGRRDQNRDSYRALVLSKPTRQSLLDEINSRRGDEIDFLPWEMLREHPLAQSARKFQGAVNQAIKAWQNYQEAELQA